jgi:predicted permease
MFLAAFKTTFGSILELAVLGAIGFFIVRRSLLSEAGLKSFSDLVIGLFLPFFMFSEITQRFSFALYPDWWTFPVLSFLVTAVGFACGLLALPLDKKLSSYRGEFLGITSFQNAGYLPLPLVAMLFPKEVASEMFILIFLFMLGFNMTIFSVGIFLLSPDKKRKIDYKHVFNGPVIATVLALLCVFLKLNERLPVFIARPVETIGRCAIPLSILVVGGNLAVLRCKIVSYIKPMVYGLLIKLVVLPLLFLGFVLLVHPKPLVGLLLVLQAAMPPAALLSVISRSQKSEECLISQAIFYGHILSILTIPLFLALYEALAGKLF